MNMTEGERETEGEERVIRVNEGEKKDSEALKLSKISTT